MIEFTDAVFSLAGHLIACVSGTCCIAWWLDDTRVGRFVAWALTVPGRY